MSTAGIVRSISCVMFGFYLGHIGHQFNTVEFWVILAFVAAIQISTYLEESQ